MMLKTLILILLVELVKGDCGPEQTKLNEGRKLCCYYDSLRIPTIGIGFNLRRSDAGVVMARYGLNITNVLKDCIRDTRKSCLTDRQADDIFNTISYPEAASCVDQYAPSLTGMKRAAIIDVAFAGCKTLNKFKQMQQALNTQNWQKAGQELKSSIWCKQVRENRCNSDYNCIVGCSGGTCGTFQNNCSPKKDCYCMKMSNQTGVCIQDFLCSSYGDCSSCPSSTSICVVQTCCGAPRCVPKSLITYCTTSSRSYPSPNNGRLNIKNPNEKTATG